MKKLFLFPLFLFALAAHSQSYKTDTLPYHFSWKNGWAVKIAPLQIIDAELRLYVEKKISKKTSFEFFGSHNIPNIASISSEVFAGSYKSSDNYISNYAAYGNKIGVGYLHFFSANHHSYIAFESFYKNYAYDIKTRFHDLDTRYCFEVFCLQTILCKRVAKKIIFYDLFIGGGIRTRYIKAPVFPNYYREIPWKVDLENAKTSKFFPKIQIVVNIGFNIK
jgi:hypothetical protein